MSVSNSTRYKDISGQRFGRTTAHRYFKDSTTKRAKWVCICDCGTEHISYGYNLRLGVTKSCGCLNRDRTSEANTKHGGCFGDNKGERLYRIWQKMKYRCNNPNSNRFTHYGARGVKVCQPWEKDYSAFKTWAMSNGYRDDLSIDRIDNDKGYSPDNCRWADAKTQANNRRKSKSVLI